MKTYDIVNAGPRNRFMVNGRIVSNSGRDVQFQNQPRPVKAVEKNLDRALELLRAGDYQTILTEFPVPPMDVVAGCIRSAFIASPGHKLGVCDLNAIENRALGWLARCKSILDVFDQGKDPYLDFAVDLYDMPYESITKIDPVTGEHKPRDERAKEMRQNAKPAVLGAGYRLGGGDEKTTEDGDVIKTGLWGYAAAMGVDITRDEAHRQVRVFREKFPEVKQFWYDMENAAMYAILRRRPQTVGHVRFEYLFEKDVLCMILPSGRALHYLRPRIEDLAFGDYKPKQTLTFDGKDAKTKQWTRITSHGGPLTENCLAGDTWVVTRRGLVQIGQIKSDDLLWDGIQWVAHSGVISKGIQEVVEWNGLVGTPEHRILAGSMWKELAAFTDERIGHAALLSGLASEAALWSNLNQEKKEERDSCVTAGVWWRRTQEMCGGGAYRVPNALMPAEVGLRLRPRATMSYPTQCCGAFGFIASPGSNRGATTHPAKCTRTTAAGEFLCTGLGETARRRGWSTPLLSRDGTNWTPTLTASTTTETTSRETYAWLTGEPIQTIAGRPFTCPTTERPCRTATSSKSTRRSGPETPSLSISPKERASHTSYPGTRRQEVFDILNSGPNHRFAVMTDRGQVLAHNCVQAVARDLLLNGLFLADQKGLSIIGHVHDEILTEIPTESPLSLSDLRECMVAQPSWAPDLPLGAEGWVGSYYKKG